MQAFRDLIKGWLGKILLGIVVLVFGAFGTESLLSIATRPKPPAEVNGEPIPQASVERAMAYQRQRLQERFGKDIDPSILEADLLRPQAIEVLVEKELLLQYAQENDFRISRNSIAKWVMSMPQFKKEGVFSEELYKRTVASLGYSPQQLEDELMKDLAVAQVRTTISNSAFLTQNELEYLAKLESQTRDLSYIVLDHQKFLPEVEVSEEEIQSHYNDNTPLYKIEEQVQLAYLELKADDYLQEAQQGISEEDINVAYAAMVAEIEQSEERRSAHILAEIHEGMDDEAAKKKIEEAREKLENGEEFSSVAKQYSDDIGSAESGGDLGFAKRGDFTGPFEDALYDLDVGEVSETVQSEFGYHIIQLIEVKQSEIPTLESKRKQLLEELSQELAEERYLEALDNVADIAFNASDLQQSAEVIGQPIQQTEWISRSGQLDGVFSEPTVIAAAFSDEVIHQGHNSEFIELSADSAIILRKVDHKAESIKPLASVKDEIIDRVKLNKARGMTKEMGQKMVAKLKNKAPTEDIASLISGYYTTAIDQNTDAKQEADENQLDSQAKSDDVKAEPLVDMLLPWKVEENVGRFSAKVARDITDAVFKFGKPIDEKTPTYGGVQIKGNDFAVVALLSVTEPDSETLIKESKNLARFLNYQFGNLEYQNFSEQLKNTAEVVVN